MRASSTCCEITSTSCAKGCASTPKSRLNDRTCGYRANGEKVAAATVTGRSRKHLTSAGGLETLNAAARGSATRPALRCARRQISRLSALGPPGGLDEPEPGWLASTEDTDEVDAHHACGRHRCKRQTCRSRGSTAGRRRRPSP